MRFYANESTARAEIASLLKPIYGSAMLFVAERNQYNVGLREVIFVAKVPKDDAKSEQAVNAITAFTISNAVERLEWQGSKMDFLNDNETEYLMVKAMVQNG